MWILKYFFEIKKNAIRKRNLVKLYLSLGVSGGLNMVELKAEFGNSNLTFWNENKLNVIHISNDRKQILHCVFPYISSDIFIYAVYSYISIRLNVFILNSRIIFNILDISTRIINIFFLFCVPIFQEWYSWSEGIQKSCYVWYIVSLSNMYSSCQQGLEEADCILCREVRPPSPLKKRLSWAWQLHLMVMLHFWRSEGLCRILSLPLLPGWLWLGLVVPVKIPCMDQIDLFKKYLYLIGLYAKKPCKKQLHKKCKYECNSLTSWHKIRLDKLMCH